MKTKKTVKPKVQIALKTQYSIGFTNNIVFEKIHAYVKPTGLTTVQFLIMDILGNYGPLKISEIYKKMLIKNGNKTMIIDSLENKNLIKRIFGKNDRREIIIELTDEGQKFYSDNVNPYNEFIQKMMSGLNQNEQRELNLLLDKLSSSI